MSRPIQWSPKLPEIATGRSRPAVAIQSNLLAGRIPLLDGFRAIAVLLVILAHSCQLTGFPYREHLQAVLSAGQTGVDIFFVLSGFLITTLLIREHKRTRKTAIGPFYFRRCVRILPAYFTFLATVFILEKIGPQQLTQQDWLGALTYTTNFLSDPSWRLGHLWSLSIEEHFYLVWPFAFAFVSPQKRWQLPVACIGLSILVRVLCYVQFPESAWMCNRWTFTRCNAISIGCLLSLLAFSKTGCLWTHRLGSAFHPAIYAAVLVASVALSRLYYAYAIITAPVINGLLIAGLIWSCLLRQDCRSVRWLDHKYLRMIGIRSYSIYLWQQLVLAPGSQCIGDSLILTMAAIALMAEASWLLVELPMLRWKQAVSSATHNSGSPPQSVQHPGLNKSAQYQSTLVKESADV